jgi:hypothetical protein
VEEDAGRLTAVFGYVSKLRSDLTIDVGKYNSFFPGAADRGQPRRFQNGDHRSSFAVTFEGPTLEWRLNGNTVTASRSTPLCADDVELVGQGGKKRGKLKANRRPKKGEGLPGASLLGPPKGDSESAPGRTPEELYSQYGVRAKRPSGLVDVDPSTGPKIPKPPIAPTGVFARVGIQLTPSGVSATDGFLVPDGALLVSRVLEGDTLIVLRRGGVVVHVLSTRDPRDLSGASRPLGPPGHSMDQLATGKVLVSLPSSMVGSEAGLRATTFEVYKIASTVPRRTPLTASSLTTLLRGGRLLGTIAGSAYVPYFFPRNP